MTQTPIWGDDWDPYEHGQWIWNGSTVFEEDYMNSLMEATGDMEGSALSEMECIVGLSEDQNRPDHRKREL